MCASIFPDTSKKFAVASIHHASATRRLRQKSAETAAAILELAAHAEARLTLDGIRESVALAARVFACSPARYLPFSTSSTSAVIDRELYAAPDVHTNGTRYPRRRRKESHAR